MLEYKSVKQKIMILDKAKKTLMMTEAFNAFILIGVGVVHRRRTGCPPPLPRKSRPASLVKEKRPSQKSKWKVQLRTKLKLA